MGLKTLLVLDVPQEAVSIMFGFGIAGAGQVWADDFELEVVSSDVMPTHPLLRFKLPFGEKVSRFEAMAKVRRLQGVASLSPSSAAGRNPKRP